MIYLYGIKTLSTQFYMRRKYQLEYKRSAHKGRFFGAAGLPYSIETVAKFMFARQSVALLARGVRPLRRHTKKCAHKGRIFFGAADLPYSIETVAKFMFARQSVALLARGVRPLRRHTKKAPTRGAFFLVPLIGVEPIRYRYHRILSPARLPIPPQRQATKLYNTNL